MSRTSSNDSICQSLAEMRCLQKERLKLIEKTRKSIGKNTSNASSQVSSSSRDKYSERSRYRKGTTENSRGRSSHRPRRSRSLLTLCDLNPVRAKNVSCDTNHSFANVLDYTSRVPSDLESRVNASDLSTDEEGETFKTFPTMSSTKRKKSISLQCDHGVKHQLWNVIERLNKIRLSVQEGKRKTGKYPGLDMLLKEQQNLSMSLGKQNDDISKCTRVIDELTKHLQNDVVVFINITSEDKICLEELRSDNATLNLQLQKSLQMQRTLEGRVSELSKEKSWLETENKTLALKMIPLITSLPSPSQKEAMVGKCDENGNFVTTCVPSASRESNHLESGSKVKCTFSEMSRWGSSHFGDVLSFSQSQVSVISSGEEDMDNENGIHTRRDDLDSITSFVRRKSKDVGRLEGELHKYRETAQQLEKRICNLSQEYQVTLADFGDIVESYRALEKERDNYESILKLILKEKSSSDSNIHELLDNIIRQLNSSSSSNKTLFQKQDICDDSDSNDETMSKYNRFSSKDFLQSVLQVIQGQNISLREEMSRIRHSLHETTGQNTLLQSNNEGLTEKVQDLKKQLDMKEQEAERAVQIMEKSDNLEKLYQAVVSAKAELEESLKEKEQEIEMLKSLIEKFQKDAEGQSEKMLELQKTNEKMEKEVNDFKNDIDKLNQTIGKLRSCLKDEEGLWCDKVSAASNEVAIAKEHCKWLQSQVENLNSQLVGAHDRIKLHEQDKAILAQKVLSAEEERKMLDRKIFEIKSIMHRDIAYQEALVERNAALQQKINDLRKQCSSVPLDMSGSESNYCSMQISLGANGESDHCSGKRDNTREQQELHLKTDASQPSSTPAKKVNLQQQQKVIRDSNNALALSRVTYGQSRRFPRTGFSQERRHHPNAPRAAVSLHNPAVVCCRGKK